MNNAFTLKENIDIRNINQSDIKDIRKLLAICEPYVLPYSNYVYWILENYYSSSCFVATINDEIIGFISAMPSIEKEIIFVWQISINSNFRGMGIGKQLLDKVVDSAQKFKMNAIQFSIDSNNAASKRLFMNLADRLESPINQVGTYKDDKYEENLYQIKL